MAELLTEHSYLTSIVWPLLTLILFVLVIIYYRKKKFYERMICTLFGNEEAAFEFYEEATKLEKQDIKSLIIGAGEKGRVAEAVKQVKARHTAAERKEDMELRKQDLRLVSIVKLANINRSQILDQLSKKK